MPQSYNILNQSVAYWGRLNSHHCQLSFCPSYDFMSSGAQSYKKGARISHSLVSVQTQLKLNRQL